MNMTMSKTPFGDVYRTDPNAKGGYISVRFNERDEVWEYGIGVLGRGDSLGWTVWGACEDTSPYTTDHAARVAAAVAYNRPLYAPDGFVFR